MVKRFFSIISAMLLILSSFTLFAFAETDSERMVLRLVDEADILSASQEMRILDALNEQSEKIGYDINILTVKSLEDNTSYDYADNYYKEKNLGIGEKKNGFILLLSVEPSRHIQIIANGTPSKEYVMDDILAYIMDDLKEYEYESAFMKYIDYIVDNKGQDDVTKNKNETPEKKTEKEEKDTSVFKPYEEKVIPAERQKPRLVDAANLIPDDREKDILALLDEKSEELKFEIAIVTTLSTNGVEPMVFADDYYDYNGFGIGENRDGAVLLISLKPRYVYISTCGKGIKILSETRWNNIIDNFYDSLTDGDYEAVANSYISDVEDYVNRYNALPIGLIFVALLIGFIISLIVIGIMKSKHISVAPQDNAQYYIVPGSMKVTKEQDTFLYRNISKTQRPKNTSSSGSGGSHTSSSGTRHGGGGRSF